MDITASHAQRHSKKEFRSKFSLLVDSGVGIMHVRANEVVRASIAIKEQVLIDGGSIVEWDIVNGFRSFTMENYTSSLVTGDGQIDINEAFARPLSDVKDSAKGFVQCYIFTNMHYWMENSPTINHLIQTYSHILPSSDVAIVILTPDIPLLGDSASKLLSLTFETPGLGELTDSLNTVIEDSRGSFPEWRDIPEDGIDKVCYVGAGMTQNQFEMYSAIAVVTAGRDGKDTVTSEDLVDAISLGKTDVVNSNDILELYPSSNMQDVGGLDNLKAWVAKRKGCYSDDAKEFGIEPPKGIVLVGVPGSGKSLIAKAISSELGVPLVRLDFGRVFNSLVGASEQRMRTALKMVESMAPVCLFCDEVDKGLGGIGGSGDSGTSNRVLGSFLTWLQECKHPVFTIVTANNVTGLPPEMLRRGRFDAIFSTTLPTYDERLQVLKIHLRLRNRDIGDFEWADVQTLITCTEGYVPAEIESAVKDALIDSFSEGTELTIDHIRKAVNAMVPLSKAFGPQIAAMNEWALANATPATRQGPIEPNTPAKRVSRIRRGK